MLILTSLLVHLFCYFSFSFLHRHTVVRIKTTAGKGQGFDDFVTPSNHSDK